MRGFVLGVDLDGVCGDYESALRTSVAARRGVDPTSLEPQRTMDHFAEWDLTAEGFQEAHRLAVVEDRIFRTMRPYADVAEVLWRLSDAGVWIRIITHRLLFNGLHESSAADTAVWLDQHDIPYRDLCFIGDKAMVGADVYIDDSPHNIIDLREAGRTAVIFDQVYNRFLDGPRVRNWREAEPLILSHLNRDVVRGSTDEEEDVGG